MVVGAIIKIAPTRPALRPAQRQYSAGAGALLNQPSEHRRAAMQEAARSEIQVPAQPLTGPGAEPEKPKGPLEWLATNVARILISLFVPIITFIGLYAGFVFLRDSQAPKGIIAVVAIIWGVGGVALLYFVSNSIVERLGD